MCSTNSSRSQSPEPFRLYKGLSPTHGPSKIRDQTCDICLTTIEPDIPTFTHISGCQRTWCRECFFPWMRPARITCPSCRKNLFMLPRRGVYDKVTGETRVVQPHSSVTYIAGGIPEAHQILSRQGETTSREDLHRQHDGVYLLGTDCEIIDVKFSMSTQELLQQRRLSGLKHDDLMALWIYSRLFPVSAWSENHFSGFEDQRVFLPMPVIEEFLVAGSIAKVGDLPGWTDVKYISEDTNEADLLQVPIPSRLIRHFVRLTYMQCWSYMDSSYSDWKDEVEDQVNEVNRITGTQGVNQWRLLSVRPWEDSDDLRLVAIPWTLDGQENHPPDLTSLFRRETFRTQFEAGRELGWDRGMDERILRQYELKYLRSGGSTTDDLEQEVLDWWGEMDDEDIDEDDYYSDMEQEEPTEVALSEGVDSDSDESGSEEAELTEFFARAYGFR